MCVWQNMQGLWSLNFEGLEGSVATGCMQTPGYMSRYCHEHSLHTCRESVDSPENVTEVIVGKKYTIS